MDFCICYIIHDMATLTTKILNFILTSKYTNLFHFICSNIFQHTNYSKFLKQLNVYNINKKISNKIFNILIILNYSEFL